MDSPGEPQVALPPHILLDIYMLKNRREVGFFWRNSFKYRLKIISFFKISR